MDPLSPGRPSSFCGRGGYGYCKLPFLRLKRYLLGPLAVVFLLLPLPKGCETEKKVTMIWMCAFCLTPAGCICFVHGNITGLKFESRTRTQSRIRSQI